MISTFPFCLTDSDQQIDIIVPACLDDSCEESIILVYSGEKVTGHLTGSWHVVLSENERKMS